MNTVNHRHEIETAVGKLFVGNSTSEGNSTSFADMRAAILKIAGAVQAIIVEIERTRSR